MSGVKKTAARSLFMSKAQRAQEAAQKEADRLSLIRSGEALPRLTMVPDSSLLMPGSPPPKSIFGGEPEPTTDGIELPPLEKTKEVEQDAPVVPTPEQPKPPTRKRAKPKWRTSKRVMNHDSRRRRANSRAAATKAAKEKALQEAETGVATEAVDHDGGEEESGDASALNKSTAGVHTGSVSDSEQEDEDAVEFGEDQDEPRTPQRSSATNGAQSSSQNNALYAARFIAASLSAVPAPSPPPSPPPPPFILADESQQQRAQMAPAAESTLSTQRARSSVVPSNEQTCPSCRVDERVDSERHDRRHMLHTFFFYSQLWCDLFRLYAQLATLLDADERGDGGLAADVQQQKLNEAAATVLRAHGVANGACSWLAQPFDSLLNQSAPPPHSVFVCPRAAFATQCAARVMFAGEQRTALVLLFVNSVILRSLPFMHEVRVRQARGRFHGDTPRSLAQQCEAAAHSDQVLLAFAHNATNQLRIDLPAFVCRQEQEATHFCAELPARFAGVARQLESGALASRSQSLLQLEYDLCSLLRRSGERGEMPSFADYLWPQAASTTSAAAFASRLASHQHHHHHHAVQHQEPLYATTASSTGPHAYLSHSPLFQSKVAATAAQSARSSALDLGAMPPPPPPMSNTEFFGFSNDHRQPDLTGDGWF